VEVPLAVAADDAGRLRECLNDLISITALPALWTGGDAPHIASTVLDALLEMLHLTFVFARLIDSDGSALDVSRVSAALKGTISTQMLAETLTQSMGATVARWPPRAQLPLPGTMVSVACVPLGLHREMGTIVAGAMRLTFPEPTERLVLDVAANQAAIGLQQARALREQRTARERDWRVMLESIPGLTAVLTADGTVEAVNQQIMDYTGQTLEQLRSWGTNGTVHADDLPHVAERFTTSIAASVPYEIEQRLRRFDGAYRWFNNRGFPVRDDAGRTWRWYVLLTDIDERKRAEAELKRSEMLLSEGLRLSATGTFWWEVDTDELRFSQELYRIFELAPGVVTFARVRERVHPDDQQLLAQRVEAVRSGRDNPESEIRLRLPDGRVRYLRVFARLIRHPDGRRECVGAVQDVTRRRLAEDALDEARSELTHVARVTSLSTLAASIAHEVNQPLSGIVTNASTCLRLLDVAPPDVDGARETARRAIRDGLRAADVIARLRALFTRKEFTLELLDLNEAIREVIALSLSDLQRNRVIIQSELAVDLPTVIGDRVQLQQVVLNLVRNASDAMAGVDDRPRDLVVGTAHDADDTVRVSVRDVGVGIEAHHLDKLFEAFYTTKSDGMGIGLSVSRSIVERHRGRIWAEPNEGPGTTFAFRIPRETSAAAFRQGG
jgi:PAS domain S-box-containing protein